MNRILAYNKQNRNVALSGLNSGDVKEISVKILFAPDTTLCTLTLPVDNKSKIFLGNYQSILSL